MKRSHGEFNRGDTVRWTTPAGTRLMCVVEVWNTGEPYQLLVTDVQRDTMKCYTVLQVDCENLEPKESEEEV